MRDVPARILVVVLIAAIPACAGSAAAGRAGEPRDHALSASAQRAGPDAAAEARPSTPASTTATFTVSRLGPWARRYVMHTNWHPGCPVPVRRLRLLRLSYVGFDGEIHTGPMVVNERVAAGVLWVFRRLYAAGFPIKKVALAKRYRPNAGDYASPVRDVTAAFSCRPVTENPGLYSQHAYGWAIDVNPLENPYVRSDGTVLRRADEPFARRSRRVKGMIHPGDLIVRLFDRIGFGWGGDWSTVKDYMHFSRRTRALVNGG
jgi:D-alanyl-D-alanine carboxypeptidase